MSIIEQMVENVLDTQFEKFDRETIDYAKIRIIDTIGAIIGGANSSGSDMMLELVRDWGGKEESTIIPVGDKVPAANAAMVMGIMARSNDFEPGGGPAINGKKYPGHYSATTVPTAFVMAERLGKNCKELITALILGDDLTGRIGVAGAAPWDIGWDPAGLCSRFGATAIAGKLMGLNKDQILNGLGIVLNQLSGTMQAAYDYTHSFKLTQGIAAWNGIVSAELASRGFTGPRDPLQSKFGYFRQYCREIEPEIMTQDLGEKFYADDEFKLYPCCRGNSGSVESALKLVRENDFDHRDIVEITVDLSPMWVDSFLIQPFKAEYCPQASAILNLRYNVANALMRKDVKLEHYTKEAIQSPEIMELIEKIKINPTVPGKRMSSRVVLKMSDGRELSAFTEVPRGDWLENPLSKEEIFEKFRCSAAFSRVITPEKAEEALTLLGRFEEISDLKEVIRLLVRR